MHILNHNFEKACESIYVYNFNIKFYGNTVHLGSNQKAANEDIQMRAGEQLYADLSQQGMYVEVVLPKKLWK